MIDFGISSPSSSTVASLKVALALCAAGSLVWTWADHRRGSRPAASRVRDALLVGAAVLAPLAWLDFQPQRLVVPHLWEFYHHVLGSKYFGQLGYTGLYDCTVFADYEDGFSIPPETRPVRDLATNRVVTAADILADATRCPLRSSSSQWSTFRADVGWFRERMPPRRWAAMLTDHGMNATPAWVMLGSWLAGTTPVGEARVRALVLADVLLLSATWAALFWAFGWRSACVALIFWATIHPARGSWTMGAYLRQDWFAATGMGLAFLRRDRSFAAGCALTVAALLRVFPGFLLVALALRAGLACVRRRSWRPAADDRRLALGCAAMLVIGLAAPTLWSGRPDAWREFAVNSRKHLDTPLVNFMGLPTVIAFDFDTRLRHTKNLSAPDPYGPWHAAVRAQHRQRAAFRWAAALGFGVLLALAVRFQTPSTAAILGIGLVVIAGQVGSYYYAILAFYGLLTCDRKASGGEWVGAGLLALSAATWAIASSGTREEEPYVAASLLCSLFVLAVTIAMARPARPLRSGVGGGRA